MTVMEIPKIKNRFEVLNSANTEETDLYMYGSISAYSWYDGISSSKVREQLKNVTAKTINVHINSGGGDVFESIAISNLLKIIQQLLLYTSMVWRQVVHLLLRWQQIKL